jgi:molybdopterin/thiamine biosynthesis adenylyltransferase
MTAVISWEDPFASLLEFGKSDKIDVAEAKVAILDPSLRNRYSRQTVMPGIGEEGQAKLLSSSAVILGCGALGCNIANLLVRAGVGKVKIVDRDFIEYHNLQRQVLFDEEDIRAKLPKAVAAERHLNKVNSTVKVTGVVADVNYTNIEELCRGVDIILDGLDNAETRFLINDVSLKHKIPWVYGAAVASSGMTMSIIPGETPCLRCIYPSPPPRAVTPTCETAGILGTVPAIVGSLQATEAMKILMGDKEINRDLICIDVWYGTFQHFKIKSRENCTACAGTYEFLNEKFDVKTTVLCGQSRSVQVVSTGAKYISLSKLAKRLKGASDVTLTEHMLDFMVEDYEIAVFPDGRAVIKNTTDESTAKELYDKYVRQLS